MSRAWETKSGTKIASPTNEAAPDVGPDLLREIHPSSLPDLGVFGPDHDRDVGVLRERP